MAAKKMKPTSVKIGIFDFKIKYNKDLIQKKQLEDGDKISGYCDKTLREIIIDPDLSIQDQQETLMHEILHGVFEYLTLAIESPTEEQYVIFGAPGILQALRDNKEVRDFVLGDIAGYEKE